MSNKLKYGSLFSGVGGFDLGFDSAGMECAFQVERDATCARVLSKHWPEVPRFDDVRKFDAKAIDVRPDILCGGFPCQDISVAGKRTGLAGERSGLWWEFYRIVSEFRPRWVCIENVAGLLSSWSAAGPDAPPSGVPSESDSGRRIVLDETSDLHAIICALAELGYFAAYRVLDSRWFGVPQRRRRVFIVGCLGDVCARAGVRQPRGFRHLPAEVLFEPECLPWDYPPSKKAGQGVAKCLANGTNASRFDGETENSIAGTLTGGASGGKSHGKKSGTDKEGFLVAQSVIAFTQKDCGQDAGEEESPTLRAMTHSESHSNGGGQVAIAFTQRTRKDGSALECRDDEAFCLDAPAEGGRKKGGVVHEQIVRRLTPRECERLQGFPDDWTKFDAGGKVISDSARYRMLGNAVTVNVAAWLAARIAAVDASTSL